MGLDMATMLDVLNGSSGQSAATSDRFANHVVTGTYASGFANTLMAKDLALYLAAVEGQGTPAAVGGTTADVWRRFAAADPAVDFTRIYPFTVGSADWSVAADTTDADSTGSGS
jgi:3-hydroxyisobutyrate dehydrogenase-like beta-hydroxyacid dehydrogenase